MACDDENRADVHLVDVTPEMIEACAKVILGRCGDEWTTLGWAMRIAEDCLEAALRLQKAEPCQK